MKEAAIIQTVSHEFRTPLTIVRGTATTLEYCDAETAKDLLPALHRATDRLEELIDTVLLAAGALDDRRSNDHQAFHLGELIDATISQLGARGRVRVRVLPEAAELWTDPHIMRSLLRCLVDNALKFSLDDTPVEVVALRHSSRAEIRVRNTGQGFAPDFVDAAFLALTQQDASTTRTRGGLGIGLFAAHHFAAQLGGAIDISPTRGGVTEVTVWIPRRRQDELVAPENAAAEPKSA